MAYTFDYGRLPSLRRSIIVLNVVLVLFSILALGLVSLHLINRQATSHALQVAELSGTMTRDAIARVPVDIQDSATILRDRPTLASLASRRNWNDLELFLDQFRLGGNLDAVAVVIDDRVVGQVGDDVLTRLGSQVDPAQPHTSWLMSDNDESGPLAVAIMPLPDDLVADSGFVVVSRRVNDSFLQQFSRGVASSIRLLPRHSLATAASGTPEREILYTEQPVVRAMPADNLYVAGLPLAGDDGRMIAAVMTYLPTEPFEKNRNRLIRRWLSLSIVMALAAVAVGSIIGGRIGRPIQALIRSARRMADQDFSTPVPVARDRELSILSRSMDDMRRRVKELTAALRHREAQAQLLLANVVEGVFAVDAQRRLVYLNPQAARMLDVDADHAIGRFCGDILKPREVNGKLPCHHNCPIIQSRSGGGARAHETLQCSHPQRSVIIHSAPPSGGQQVQIMRDETHTEAGRRLRDAVIANVSHEFKTPLAAQMAAIELLSANHGQLADDESLELIRSMSRATVRLNQLIDNLLESVRIDAREDRLELQPLRVEDLIEEVESLVGPLLLQKNQRLETSVEADIPEFSGDGQRLVQVLVNLLSNAIKYAPADSRITLSASKLGKAVRIVIEDEGPGLEPDQRERVFDRFYRSPGLTAGQAGMGLGLWIVRSIIKRHEGRIEAGGSASGGTSFRIFLPIRRNES